MKTEDEIFNDWLDYQLMSYYKTNLDIELKNQMMNTFSFNVFKVGVMWKEFKQALKNKILGIFKDK